MAKSSSECLRGPGALLISSQAELHANYNSRISLFLKDAGIEVKQSLYPSDATWPQQSENLKAQGITRTGKLPALEYKERVLIQVSRATDTVFQNRVDNSSTFLSCDISLAILEAMMGKQIGRNMWLMLFQTFMLIGG